MTHEEAWEQFKAEKPPIFLGGWSKYHGDIFLAGRRSMAEEAAAWLRQKVEDRRWRSHEAGFLISYATHFEELADGGTEER